MIQARLWLVTVTTASPITGPDIPTGIPLPNSGHAPQASGDRGGWAQLTLLAVIVLGVAFIAWRISRSIRRGQSRLGDDDAPSRS